MFAVESVTPAVENPLILCIGSRHYCEKSFFSKYLQVKTYVFFAHTAIANYSALT